MGTIKLWNTYDSILCCCKANRFTSILISLLSETEMGLCTLHTCCILCSLNYSKPSLEFKSRPPNPQFLGLTVQTSVMNLQCNFRQETDMLSFFFLFEPTGSKCFNSTDETRSCRWTDFKRKFDLTDECGC